MKNFLEKIFKNPIIIVIVFLLFLVPITLSQSNEKLTGILKVRPDASLKDIKKEYHKLAMKLHPDKFGSEEEKKIAEKKMFALNNDYEILSKRAKNKKPLFKSKPKKEKTPEYSNTIPTPPMWFIILFKNFLFIIFFFYILFLFIVVITT